MPVVVSATVVAIGLDAIGRFKDRERGGPLLVLRGCGGQWRVGTKDGFSYERCSRCVS